MLQAALKRLRSSKPGQGIPAIVTNRSASVTCSMRMKNMSRARTIRFQTIETDMKDYGHWSCYRAPTTCSCVTEK